MHQTTAMNRPPVMQDLLESVEHEARMLARSAWAK